MVFRQEYWINSEGDFYSTVITDVAQDLVERSDVCDGLLLVSAKHTTVGLIVIEHDAGILADLEDLCRRIAPPDESYLHHVKKYDRNGASHLLCGLIGTNVTIAVSGGRLDLGTYQDIVFIDFEQHPGVREISLTLIGTAS